MLTNYSFSRHQFLRAANQANADQKAYMMVGPKGPNGESLTTDVLTIGDLHAPNKVVVTSGLNGPALSIGSAIQCSWIDAARSMHDSYKSSISYIFVHALNPYGAAHGLRTDHTNVDPTRNFIADFDNLPATSENYRLLADAFSPPGLGFFESANAWRKMITFAFFNKNHGLHDFKQALAGGQHEFPDGLYYGGKEETWSRMIWEEIAYTSILPGRPERIYHIDLTAGTSPRGETKIMLNTDDGSLPHREVLQFAEPDMITLTAPAFAQLSGDIIDFWPQFEASAHCQITPMSLDVGTTRAPSFIEGIDILSAMMKRNTLRARFNDHHPSADTIIREMKEAFAPANEIEKNRAVGKALDMFYAMNSHILQPIRK